MRFFFNLFIYLFNNWSFFPLSSIRLLYNRQLRYNFRIHQFLLEFYFNQSWLLFLNLLLYLLYQYRYDIFLLFLKDSQSHSFFFFLFNFPHSLLYTVNLLHIPLQAASILQQHVLSSHLLLATVASTYFSALSLSKPQFS